MGCSKITSIVFPRGLESASNSLGGTKCTTVTFPDTVTTITTGDGTSLEEINVYANNSYYKSEFYSLKMV